jgi:ABC-2 type transport system permease protein
MTTELQPLPEKQTLSGFRNMLRIENSRWWNMRNILTQSAAWLLSVNFIVAMPLIVAPMIDNSPMDPVEEGFVIFLSIFSMVLAIGSVILLQGSLVGEKQSGTAAWILSNPISRPSYILSKLVANTGGIMSVGIILQGAVGYIILSYVNGAALPIASYVTAMGLLALFTLFYISFTLMLGSFFGTRGPILGAAIMFAAFQDYFGRMIEGVIKGFTSILPNRLNDAAGAILLGNPLPSIVPVASNVIFIILFIGLAIWRFEKTEF